MKLHVKLIEPFVKDDKVKAHADKLNTLSGLARDAEIAKHHILTDLALDRTWVVDSSQPELSNREKTQQKIDLLIQIISSPSANHDGQFGTLNLPHSGSSSSRHRWRPCSDTLKRS